MLTGSVIEKVPNDYPYRGFERFSDIPYSLLPSFIRSSLGGPYALENGASYAYEIGLTPRKSTSSTITFLGDAYSRHSWFGVFFYSLFFYYILYFVDTRVLTKARFWHFIPLFIISHSLFNFYSSSVLMNFRVITREMFIAIILGYLVYRFLYSSSILRK